MAIDEGERVLLKAEFRDESGTLVDPATPVEAFIERPSGTVDGPFQMSQESTGVFRYQYDTQEAYSHDWKAVAADNGQEQGSFYVKADDVN